MNPAPPVTSTFMPPPHIHPPVLRRTDYTLTPKAHKNFPISFSPFHRRIQHTDRRESKLTRALEHFFGYRAPLRIVPYDPSGTDLSLSHFKLWLHERD